MADPVYAHLSNRLLSFQRYPESAFFRPPRLTLLGFYSSGTEEEKEKVTCYGCGVSHANFQPWQNIRRVHIQSSPKCPLNPRRDELHADDVGAADDLVPQDLPGPLPNRDQQFIDEDEEDEDEEDEDEDLITYYSMVLQTEIAFNRSNPSFRLLAVEELRLRRYTFYDWSARYGDWEHLARSGLFYTGVLDEVQCCICGIMYKATLLQNEPDVRKTLCRNHSCRTYFQ